MNCSTTWSTFCSRTTCCNSSIPICMLGIVFALGCTPQPKVSDSVDAKRVLQTSLDAWKSGKTPAELKSATPPIYVGDQLWLSGAKLKDYTIKSDGEFLETSVSFPVVLQIQGEAKARQAVYWVSTNPALSVTLGD